MPASLSRLIQANFLTLFSTIQTFCYAILKVFYLTKLSESIVAELKGCETAESKLPAETHLWWSQSSPSWSCTCAWPTRWCRCRCRPTWTLPGRTSASRRGKLQPKVSKRHNQHHNDVISQTVLFRSVSSGEVLVLETRTQDRLDGGPALGRFQKYPAVMSKEFVTYGAITLILKEECRLNSRSSSPSWPS